MNDIIIGQRASLHKAFSLHDVEIFAALSEDINPVHLDAEYAKSTIFAKPIVHGFLVGSLISAVIANQLPGKGSIYLHQQMDFKKPVFHDDLITANVEVTDINYEKSIYHLRTWCENEKNEVVLNGVAIIKKMNYE